MWFALSLGAAFCFSLQSVFAKRAGESFASLWVAWSYVAGSLPVFAVFTLLGERDFALSEAMVPYVLASGVANLIALPAFFSAVQKGELSVVMPLSVLSPVFALGVEGVLYGDIPSAQASFGVVAIVVGAFSLNTAPVNQDSTRSRWSGPFRKLIDDGAARSMMVATLAWGFAASADRGGVRASNAITYAICVHSLIATALLPLLVRKTFRIQRSQPRHVTALFLSVGVGALMIIFQMIAMEQVSASIVVALKRLAALFSVLFGAFVFTELHWKRRLVSAGLMVCGALMIGLT